MGYDSGRDSAQLPGSTLFVRQGRWALGEEGQPWFPPGKPYVFLLFYLSSEVPGVMDRIHYPISLGKFLNFPEPRCISLVGINNTCLSQQWFWELSELSVFCAQHSAWHARSLWTVLVPFLLPHTKVGSRGARVQCPGFLPNWFFSYQIFRDRGLNSQG